jgi:5-methylcytosine-specific restriction endonuclease McrA
MSGMMNRPVLVLNSSFEPLRFAPARDAIKLLAKDVAIVQIEHENCEIRLGMKLPSVVRLRDFRKVPYILSKPNARNIFLRDGYQCQYCGDHLHARDLTLDHVLPKVQGGRDAWENLVACCRACNNRKGGRTPDQAGMTLLRKPRASTVHTSRSLMRQMGAHDPHWRQYLYYEN